MSAKKDLFAKYPNNYFIETGTCLGEGVYLALKAKFRNIISIELSEELYNICVKEFKYYPNVILYHGDSTELIWDIIKDINEPITFWLDAHYCGEVGYKDLISSHNNKILTPLHEEIKIIEKHHVKNHTIIIDDVRSFINADVISSLYRINKNYCVSFTDGTHRNDILIASPREKTNEIEKTKGVIQIGAHYAEEYEEWVADGVENFIFFEPIKSSYDKMLKILPDGDNIKTFNMALGNFEGSVDMFVETEHQGKSCSILPPKKHLDQYPDISFDGEETVPVNKLDNVRYDRSLYDHLHIDAQGYELEILKGAVGSFGFIKTIQVEVYREELYDGCPMIDQIIKFLYDYGFVVEWVKWRGNTWGDCFLIKENKNEG